MSLVLQQGYQCKLNLKTECDLILFALTGRFLIGVWLGVDYFTEKCMLKLCVILLYKHYLMDYSAQKTNKRQMALAMSLCL